MKASGINGVYAAKQKESKPCDAWLELAETLAQAERRYTKLRNNAEGLSSAMVECLDWADKQRVAINKFKTDLGKDFQSLIDQETAEADRLEMIKKRDGDATFDKRQSNCSNYCFWSELEVKENEHWTTVKQKLALVTKTIAEPFQVEAFLTMSGDIYKSPEPKPATTTK